MARCLGSSMLALAFSRVSRDSVYTDVGGVATGGCRALAQPQEYAPLLVVQIPYTNTKVPTA
jgi:hypothetical protein